MLVLLVVGFDGDVFGATIAAAFLPCPVELVDMDAAIWFRGLTRCDSDIASFGRAAKVSDGSRQQTPVNPR